MLNECWQMLQSGWRSRYSLKRGEITIAAWRAKRLNNKLREAARSASRGTDRMKRGESGRNHELSENQGCQAETHGVELHKGIAEVDEKVAESPRRAFPRRVCRHKARAWTVND